MALTIFVQHFGKLVGRFGRGVLAVGLGRGTGSRGRGRRGGGRREGGRGQEGRWAFGLASRS